MTSCECPSTDISVQTGDFDPGVELCALSAGDDGVGAVASFLGLVRASNEGTDVSAMCLEHYPGMTEKALGGIVAEARQRWCLGRVRIIHRVGPLAVGDRIVFVGVASAHRGEAFQACEFIMDFLKTRAPFWKKERTETGEQWVDARESDAAAAKRWGP